MTVLATIAASQLLKNALLIRPDLVGADDNLVEVSFPSGHVALTAALVAGVALVAPERWRPALAAVGAAWLALTAGAVQALYWHRPSDVFGATLLACAGYCAAHRFLHPGSRPSMPRPLAWTALLPAAAAAVTGAGREGTAAGPLVFGSAAWICAALLWITIARHLASAPTPRTATPMTARPPVPPVAPPVHSLHMTRADRADPAHGHLRCGSYRTHPQGTPREQAEADSSLRHPRRLSRRRDGRLRSLPAPRLRERRLRRVQGGAQAHRRPGSRGLRRRIRLERHRCQTARPGLHGAGGGQPAAGPGLRRGLPAEPAPERQGPQDPCRPFRTAVPSSPTRQPPSPTSRHSCTSPRSSRRRASPSAG
ncbi:phosphatase PAP2 family protein [Streptomyces sp. CS62]|uniref:phosphatase PAP2 family protein n=1 Tax=Streptomyces sp. CS62 TaxID=3119268 RepID=UPI003FA7EAEC